MAKNKDYSDFVKESIKKVYVIINNFIKSHEIESEDKYWNMRRKVEDYRICIPEEIYNKTIQFIDEKLSPIIYDESYFKDFYSDEIGHVDEEKQVFVIRDEDALNKVMDMFLMLCLDLEEVFEEFGMKEYYPILVN